LSRRYGHSLDYLESLAAAAGFVVKDILKTNLRKEEGVYLTGDAVLMRAGARWIKCPGVNPP
jgi:predicted TPR repeat methyltransferase